MLETDRLGRQEIRATVPGGLLFIMALRGGGRAGDGLRFRR